MKIRWIVPAFLAGFGTAHADQPTAIVCDVAILQTHATWHFTIDTDRGLYTLRQNGTIIRRQGPYIYAKGPDGNFGSVTFNLMQPIGMYLWAIWDRQNNLWVKSFTGAFTNQIGTCHDDKAQGM